MNDLGIVKRNIVRADTAAVEQLALFGSPPCTRRWAASA